MSGLEEQIELKKCYRRYLFPEGEFAEEDYNEEVAIYTTEDIHKVTCEACIGMMREDGLL